MGIFDQIRRLMDVPSRNERAEAALKNVQLDANLFRNLCVTLRSEAPANAPILVLEAQLEMPAGKNDVAEKTCDVECHVMKSSGKNAKFEPSHDAKNKMCEWLHELRDSMVRQKQPKWKGIKLTVDVPGDKYSADFRYK